MITTVLWGLVLTSLAAIFYLLILDLQDHL